jgi:two-component system CheB/CheR fusion protein
LNEELRSLEDQLTEANSQLCAALERQNEVSENLSAFLDISPMATIFVDEDLNIKAFNSRAQAFFSLIESDIGRPVEEMQPKLPGAELRKEIITANVSGTLHKRDIQCLSGEWYICAVTPCNMDKMTIRGSVVTFTDITKLKASQVASRSAQSQSTAVDADHGSKIIAPIHNSRVRGRADTEEGPRAEQQTSEERNQANSRLLMAALHEMIQPLQSIRLLQGILEHQVTNPSTRFTLSNLGDAADHLAELIDSLLEVHQIETGRLKIDVSELSAASIFAQLTNEFLPFASAKAVELRVVSSHALVRMNGRLTLRILRHLLSDAIKHTERGKILMGCRRRGNNMRMEFWVRGSRFPADSMRIGLSHYQNVDQMHSIGFGVQVAERLANHLNCHIAIQSDPGKGDMVALVIRNGALPLLPAADPSNVVTEDPSIPELLLIQNDTTQLAALGSILRQHGYRVAGARSTSEALAHDLGHSSHGPSIIVADSILHDGVSGVEIVGRLRNAWGKEIPALILSDRLQDAQLPRDHGNQILVLSQPIRLAALLATIEAMVQRVIPGWNANSAIWGTLAEFPSVSDPLSEIAVVEDDAGVRAAVRAMLESCGYKVDTFASAEEFLADPDRSRFQCLLVDYALRGMNGLELQSRLKQEPRRPSIIFLSTVSDTTLAVRAMRDGAIDFLQKPVDNATLREAVTRVMEQDATAEPTPSQLSVVEARLALLTKREREIMDRIVVGQLNKNIAFDLQISERTIEHHRQSIMRKMNVKSVAMLVRMIAEVERKRP